jgi:anti-anti-sigma factor
MALDLKELDDVTLVQFPDRILIGDFDFREIIQAAHERGTRKFLLDFGGVEYVSSDILGRLITAYAELRKLNGWIALFNVNSPISELMTITKLDQFIRILKKGSDDNDEDLLGGVKSRLIPPKPSDKGSIALTPPPTETDE